LHFAETTLHLGVGDRHVARQIFVLLGLQGGLGHQRPDPSIVEGVVPHGDLFFEDAQTLAGLGQLALKVPETAFNQS
jgi:hypothetical protein